MKQILLPSGERKKLAALFGVSVPTVWSALKWKTRSRLSEQIRQAALKRGGKIYEN